MSQKTWLLVLVAGVLAFLALLNAGGWRARILARLLRTDNHPVVVPLPVDFRPTVPPGFKASILTGGFEQPRWLGVAPNADVFVADSAVGKIIVLHSPFAPGGPMRETFADHLNLPFGIAFHGNYVYVATTNEVLRFRYDPRTAKRLGDAEHILGLPGFGYNQHWTRALAFRPDDTRLFVSVGSETNVSIESDPRRAAVLVTDPEGKTCEFSRAD